MPTGSSAAARHDTQWRAGCTADNRQRKNNNNNKNDFYENFQWALCWIPWWACNIEQPCTLAPHPMEGCGWYSFLKRGRKNSRKSRCYPLTFSDREADRKLWNVSFGKQCQRLSPALGRRHYLSLRKAQATWVRATCEEAAAHISMTSKYLRFLWSLSSLRHQIFNICFYLS